MTEPILTRDPLGEWAYRGLWIAIIALPAVLTFVRWAFMDKGIVWTLWIIVGVGSVAALQVILAGLAWVYRHRQWRHWLGRVSSISSFVYYGLWFLLALTFPDSDIATTFKSPLMHLFGDAFGDSFGTVLLVLVGVAYLVTLVSIVAEGEKAVALDPTGKSIKAIIASAFSEKRRPPR